TVAPPVCAPSRCDTSLITTLNESIQGSVTHPSVSSPLDSSVIGAGLRYRGITYGGSLGIGEGVVTAQPQREGQRLLASLDLFPGVDVEQAHRLQELTGAGPQRGLNGSRRD